MIVISTPPFGTRTQRALIRNMYHNGQQDVSEIAKYATCELETVSLAISNTCNDNLADDHAYINGVKGDVVNLDLLDMAELEMKVDEDEAFQVDMKLEAAPLTDDDPVIKDDDPVDQCKSE